MSWIEVSVVTVAAAFIVLVVFAVRLFITARSTLQHLGRTADNVQTSVTAATAQAEQLMQQVGKLAQDVDQQLLALEPAVRSVEKAGQAMGDVAAALGYTAKKLRTSIAGAERVVSDHHRRIQDAMEWATTGYELWQRWQSYRNAKNDTKE
ncbi:DUF948 domain-containing protein [Paenibacillus oryzisoli]|uniref:DUF948 domain-containing protein n=1 Tax=Paenibacillus oryzisoli TaxID=1850517 RepID=UPI003D2DA81D